MLEGIIIKGIAGFYYVKIRDGRIIECKARGKFRKNNLSPIVGDKVYIELIDEEHGVILYLHERKNQLVRPLVANVDQAVIVFAAKRPEILFTLLDKLLILVEHNDIESVICINKNDLDDEHVFERVNEIYGSIGYKVIKTNGLTGEGIDELKEQLNGKVSVFAGPSGVGKSTIFNRLQNRVRMETQDVSRKIDRGRHTTRHVELIDIDDNTYIVDTPGFSNLDLNFMEPYELQYSFKEFEKYLGGCKFNSCIHFREKDCRIKEAVQKKAIPVERYNAYIEILQELQSSGRIKK